MKNLFLKKFQIFNIKSNFVKNINKNILEF